MVGFWSLCHVIIMFLNFFCLSYWHKNKMSLSFFYYSQKKKMLVCLPLVDAIVNALNGQTPSQHHNYCKKRNKDSGYMGVTTCVCVCVNHVSSNCHSDFSVWVWGETVATVIVTCQVSGQQSQLVRWQWDLLCHTDSISPAGATGKRLQGSGCLSASP